MAACVFCAATLFGSDLTPLPGFSGELAASYSTFQRRPFDLTDRSDVTMKAVLAGFRFARPPRGDLGAGTPETELRARFVFPNAHTEAAENDAVPDRVMADGSGRYDNFSVLGRVPLGASLSAEAGWGQRRLTTDDLVNIGRSYFNFSEERANTSENTVYRVGLRYRGPGFEIAGHGERVSLLGRTNTANEFVLAGGNFWGASLDGRWRHGRLGASLTLEGLRGAMPVNGEFAPAFGPVSVSGATSMESARLELSYSFSRVDVYIAGTYGRTRLPFVTIAPLGAETRAYDDGFFVESASRDADVEAALRVHVTQGVRVTGFVRVSGGTEEVTLTDATLVRPSRTLNVQHRSYFPFLAGISADFSVGGTAP